MVDSGSKICVITGTTGYVGGCLKAYFLSQGWQVRELGRNQPAPFCLGQDPPADVFRGAHVLIHCAYDFKAFHWNDIHHQNVEGSIKIFKAAREAGVARSIFISTVSAFEGCESQYGKAKLMVENQIQSWDVRTVRLGLVYGSSFKGIFGNLARLLQKFSLIPLIGGGRQAMYLLHEADLAKSVYELADSKKDDRSKLVTLAHPSPVFFGDILKTVAAFHQKRVRFFSVPTSLVWLGLKSLEMLGLRPRLRSDSLIGLVKSNPHMDFQSLQQLEWSLRPFNVVTLGEGR